MMSLLVPWGQALLLLSAALVATLLPSTRSWHRTGLTLVWALAGIGLAGACFATWAQIVVTDDELYEAARSVTLAEESTPGRVSQQRLMALVSAEVGRDVYAEPVGATAEEEAYALRLSGDEGGPVVCVRVTKQQGTESSLPSSSLDARRGACE